MKVVIVLVCMLCLLVSGCFEKNVAHIYGNPESDGSIGVRVGTEVAENIEVGALTYFNPYDEGGQKYGAYSLLHIPVGPVTPYVGAEVRVGEGTWDIADSIEPVGGISYGPVFAEFQPEAIDGEDDKILLGVRFRF